SVGARPLQISIDGEGVAMPSLDINTQQHFVPLPELRRNPVITLTVSTPAPQLAGVLEHRWPAPVITTPLPVLDRTWLVTLPPGMQRVENGKVTADTNVRPWYAIW